MNKNHTVNIEHAFNIKISCKNVQWTNSVTCQTLGTNNWNLVARLKNPE